MQGELKVIAKSWRHPFRSNYVIYHLILWILFLTGLEREEITNEKISVLAKCLSSVIKLCMAILVTSTEICLESYKRLFKLLTQDWNRLISLLSSLSPGIYDQNSYVMVNLDLCHQNIPHQVLRCRRGRGFWLDARKSRIQCAVICQF